MHPSHDASYHRLFAEPAMVQDLLRHFVEELWVAELDYARMERINAKFHGDSLESGATTR